MAGGVLSRLEILLHANTANFRRNMRRAADDARSSMGDIQKKAAVVAKGATAAFAVTSVAVGSLAAAIVPVQRKFDQMQGQLVTATGSYENAAHAMAALNQFAAQTPYDLEQSVIGFTKLVNLGLTPSERALTSYGNTASAMGKSMEQMIEAVADAATGEFERLKEFGIKSSKEGDRVTFTFRGIKTEVGQNAAEIEKYLMGLGEVEFAGAMANQMDTLNGRISQAEIAMDGLKLAIAQSGIGDIMKAAVEETTETLEGMTAFIKGPEFNGALNILASTFAGFETDSKNSITAVENKLGNGLSDMNTANNRTLTVMADDWAVWASATIAAVSTAVVVSMGELDKLAIAMQTVGKFVANGFNPFGIAGIYSEYEKRMAASTANAARLQNIVDKRFDAQTAARTKANQEAAAAIDALKNKTAETGDQLARYGQQADAQQEKSIEKTKKQAAAEKALARQREKEAKDRLRQLEEINRKLREDARFIEDIRGDYDPFVKLETEFKRRWSEIQNAMSGASQKTIDSVFAIEERLATQADVEEQVRQRRRLGEFTDYLTDKRTRLQEYYQQESELAQSAFDLTAEQKEIANKSLNAQMVSDIARFEMDIESRLNAIRAPFIDDITREMTDASIELLNIQLSTDYTPDDFERFKAAINERRDYEIAQIEFARTKELDAASDHQKTELQLIEQRYKYERQEIELSSKAQLKSITSVAELERAELMKLKGISEDLKQTRLQDINEREKALSAEVRVMDTARIAAINAREAKAAFDLRNSANDAYQAQKADLGGYAAEYGIKQQFADRLKIIQDALDAEVIATEEAERAKYDARLEYTQLNNDLALASAAGIAGSLSDISKNLLGEQSKIHRAMFIGEKILAVSRSVMNIQVAMSSAAASLPFPGNLGAMATVASNVAGIVSTIMSLKPPAIQGQAHNGIASVPREGTWFLDKDERVVKPDDNRKLSRFLDNTDSYHSKTAPVINMTIENHAGVPVSHRVDDDGRIRVIVGEELNKQLPQHVNNEYSQFNKALKNNYHLQRNLG